MKVFVTGANGYVGAAVIAVLLKEGHEVSGQVRTEASAAKLKEMNVEPIIATMKDVGVLAQAAKAGECAGLICLDPLWQDGFVDANQASVA